MKSELNIIKKSALNLWAGRSLLPVILFLLLPARALSQTLEAKFTISSLTVCSGSSVTITNTSKGTSGGTTFIWSFGAGASQATSTGPGPFLITYTGSGPATITLTLQETPLTPSTKSTTITINALPVVSLAAAGPFCVNSSSVQLVGLPAGGTYSGTGVTPTGTFTPATAGPGSHTITYTFTDINSCTNSASIIIVVNALPAAPVVTVVDNCNGTSTLSTAATGILLWNTGASIASIIVNTAGTYTVTATVNGCTGPAGSGTAAPKTAPSAPVTSVTQPNCTLATGTITVTVQNASDTYSFDNGATFQASNSKSLLATGTYNIIIKNSGGCNSVATAAVVSAQPVPPAPIIGTITQPTCVLATGSVALSGLPAATTWIVTRNPGSKLIAGTGTTALEDPVPSGTYTYTVTNVSTGCTSVPSAIALVNAQPSSPAVPVQTIDCTLGFNLAKVTVTSPLGTGIEYKLDAGEYQTTVTFEGVINGSHAITVRNASGCTTTGTSFTVSCGCVNGPTIVLSSITGNTCGTAPVTIAGNVFGGNATSISLTNNGTGTLTPATITVSPFSFSYTPAAADAGKTVIITATTNNPLGVPCAAAVAQFTLIANPLPAAPTIGIITQPTCNISSGSVVLNGLPATGTWTLTSTPDAITVSGTGTTTTVSGLQVGAYSFIVKSPTGCVSAATGVVNIVLNPITPALIVSNPAPVCFPSTADLTASSVTAGSSTGLTYTYWTNPIATVAYNSPTAANDGTYYIKGTVAQSGCSAIKPVSVTVKQKPVANAGPDIAVDVQFSTNMKAVAPGINETGLWTLLSGTGTFSSASDPVTNVTNLSGGDNIFLWSVTNNVCLPSSDSVKVTVRNLVIPTLITPNMDGRNDYFVIRGKESLGKIELVIFDRNGHRVYKSNDYNNDWNGVDEKGNPLDDDTYFYILKTQTGMTYSKYIVIRR